MVPAESTRWYSYTCALRHTISLGHGAGHIIPGDEMTAGFCSTTGSGTRSRAKTILRFSSMATSGLHKFTALLMLTSESDAWCPLSGWRSLDWPCFSYVLAGGLEVPSSIAPTSTLYVLVFRTTRTPFYWRVCILLRPSSYHGDRG